MAKPFSGILRFIAFALILYLGFLFWQEFGPQKPALSQGRKAVAQSAVTRIAEDLRVSRGELKKAVVLHLKNDSTGYVTGILRETLDANGIFIVIKPSLADQIREKLMLGFPDYDALDIAISEAVKLKADAVIFGHITLFETAGAQSKLQLTINYAEIAPKAVVFQKEYFFTHPISNLQSAPVQKETGKAPGLYTETEHLKPSIIKVLQMTAAYIALVLLIPVLSIAFIRAIVKRKSNAWNAMLLSIYTGIDAMLAWVFFGLVLGSFISIVLFILSIVAAFFYNVRIMTFALKLEENE